MIWVKFLNHVFTFPLKPFHFFMRIQGRKWSTFLPSPFTIVSWLEILIWLQGEGDKPSLEKQKWCWRETPSIYFFHCSIMCWFGTCVDLVRLLIWYLYWFTCWALILQTPREHRLCCWLSVFSRSFCYASQMPLRNGQEHFWHVTWEEKRMI